MIKPNARLLLLLVAGCALSTTAYSQQVLTVCKKCIILAEQAQQRVAIADVDKKKIVWEWQPKTSNVKPGDQKWFNAISDAKPVYNLKYLLVTASGGGVALVRIADKKAVFYAYAGGNTHSAELLPDGNIVSASSTGNYLAIFKVDSLQTGEQAYSKHIPIAFGHNVVWDRGRQVLWAAANNYLKAFKYNFNCDKPDLQLLDSIALQGPQAHDLFPVYGRNILYLTDTAAVYQFDPAKNTVRKTEFTRPGIKSVSSGEADYPIIMIKPKVQWWTDEVIDTFGHTVFQQDGLKIYKARWFLPNTFSYKAGDTFKQCK